MAVSHRNIILKAETCLEGPPIHVALVGNLREPENLVMCNSHKNKGHKILCYKVDLSKRKLINSENKKIKTSKKFAKNLQKLA